MFTLSVAEMWVHNAMEHGWPEITGSVLLGALLYQLVQPFLPDFDYEKVATEKVGLVWQQGEGQVRKGGPCFGRPCCCLLGWGVEVGAHREQGECGTLADPLRSSALGGLASVNIILLLNRLLQEHASVHPSAEGSKGGELQPLAALAGEGAVGAVHERHKGATLRRADSNGSSKAAAAEGVAGGREPRTPESQRAGGTPSPAPDQHK